MGKSYLGIFRMEFKGELQYRAKAISGIATQLFWGLLQIYLYIAFLNTESVDGFSITQMASYIWLGQAFFAMRYILMGKNIGQSITNGNVCYKFVRPLNLYNQWYSETLGQKVASTLLRFPLILIIAALLPVGLGLSAPVSIPALLLCIVGILLGVCMSTTLSMFIVWLTFKTLSEKGSATIISTISGLLSGMVIPLPMMPQAVQNVINYLPFRFVSDLPFRIYIGNVGITDGLIFLAIGFAWLVLLTILGKLLIKSALKKTVIQGG